MTNKVSKVTLLFFFASMMVALFNPLPMIFFGFWYWKVSLLLLLVGVVGMIFSGMKLTMESMNDDG